MRFFRRQQSPSRQPFKFAPIPTPEERENQRLVAAGIRPLPLPGLTGVVLFIGSWGQPFGWARCLGLRTEVAVWVALAAGFCLWIPCMSLISAYDAAVDRAKALHARCLLLEDALNECQNAGRALTDGA